MRRLPLLLLATTAAAPAPDVPLYRTFGHWQVACDNLRHCEARAYDAGTPADVRILRDAGRATPIVFVVRNGRLTLGRARIDGEPVPQPDPAWLSNYAGSALSTTNSAAAHAFIAQLVAGRRLTLEDDTLPIPLDGAPEALGLIDEVQQRAGTPGPLRGPGGPGPVPPAPAAPPRPVWRRPAPVIPSQVAPLLAAARTDPAVIRARVASGCTLDAGGTAQALDAARVLVLLPCAPDPGDEPSATPVLVPRAGGPAAVFTPAYPAPLSAAPMPGALPHASFERASGELGAFARVRPGADCGFAAYWTWSAGAFRPTAMTRLDGCGGAANGHWPSLYAVAPAADPVARPH